MISGQVRRLLSFEEGMDVEFKEIITRDLANTIVAMANAEGGFILIGVRDSKDEEGKQIGEIVGIVITDENKLKIVQQCQSIMDKLFPTIRVETDEEERSIYIIEVPEGSRKPYCTASGRYLIRADGNNTPITPTMMEDLIRERLGLPKEEESPLEIFHRQFDLFLREFRDKWELERDSEYPDIDETKFVLESALGEVLEFKSQITRAEGTDLLERFTDILKRLKDLCQRRIYVDGGLSFGQFWSDGDRVIELLESVSTEIARVNTKLAKRKKEEDSSEDREDNHQ